MEFFYHDHTRFQVFEGDWIVNQCVPPYKPQVYFQVMKVEDHGVYLSHSFRYNVPNNATVHQLSDIGIADIEKTQA